MDFKTGRLYWLCEWVMRLAILNLLWIGFTMVGMVILGFFPSTAALFAVVRKWVTGGQEETDFRLFWTTFKRQFQASNLLGITIVTMGAVLVMDLKLLSGREGSFPMILTYMILALLFLYAAALLYIFPVFVHFEMKLMGYVKNSLLITLTQPVYSLATLAACVGYIVLLITFPQLLLFFSGSVLSLILTISAHAAFSRVDRLKAKNREQVNPIFGQILDGSNR